MTRARLILLLRAVFAAVFIAAALPKILAPHDFAVAVFRYQILPYALVNVVALFLPWLELVTGWALIVAPRWRDAAFTILLGMLVVFTVAIGINLHRGIDIACGCFTLKPGARHMGWWNIGRNLALLVLGAAAWLGAPRPAAARANS